MHHVNDMRCIDTFIDGICLLELSNMPIADLLQLKERLGAKMYVSDVFLLICLVNILDLLFNHYC